MEEIKPSLMEFISGGRFESGGTADMLLNHQKFSTARRHERNEFKIGDCSWKK